MRIGILRLWSNYTYTVDGKTDSVGHSAVNEKGERYLEDQFVTIAYSNTDPSNAGVLHVLEHKSSIGRFVKGFLIFAVVLGLFALVVWGWALPDEEDGEEENIPGVAWQPGNSRVPIWRAK